MLILYDKLRSQYAHIEIKQDHQLVFVYGTCELHGLSLNTVSL